MIDWDRVRQLYDEIGADEFGPLIELFMDEIEATSMRLDLSDADMLRRGMHAMLGNALNMGFDDLARMCGDGERLALTGTPQSVDLDAVLHCYARSKQLFMRDLHHVIGADPSWDVA